MRVSVLTPTCDRPVAFALAERWMARQTVPPDEWIVADGGTVPAVCTRGQRHLRQAAAPGATNLAANLKAATEAATGDVLVIWEDDDWYAPTHLETLLGLFAKWPPALAVGDDLQRYYHVGQRRTQSFQNVGAALCQTALRRPLLPLLQAVIGVCGAQGRYGIDRAFWDAVQPKRQVLTRTATVVGIKGLPGQAGLGMGHRPPLTWTSDPKLKRLAAWIGDDAAVYAPYGVKDAA